MTQIKTLERDIFLLKDRKLDLEIDVERLENKREHLINEVNSLSSILEIQKDKKQYTATNLNDFIIAVGCDIFQVSKDDLMTGNRKRELVEARRAIWEVLRMKTRKTVEDIAKTFNRDHSTLIHSTLKHIYNYETIPIYRNKYDAVERIVEEHKEFFMY